MFFSSAAIPFYSYAINLKAMQNSSYFKYSLVVFAEIYHIFLRFSTGSPDFLKNITASLPPTFPSFLVSM
jgi:hypothetical protein